MITATHATIFHKFHYNVFTTLSVYLVLIYCFAMTELTNEIFFTRENVHVVMY